jgi:hypothetical protein
MFREVLFVLFSIGCAHPALGQCSTAASDSLTTYWGHQNAVYVNSKPLKKLRGNVLLGFGKPETSKDGILIEVFDHPELAMGADPTRKRQRRLMACVTQKDGRFSFDLPPGKYELRCSKPTQWNCTSVIVETNATGSSKPLSVQLELAE